MDVLSGLNEPQQAAVTHLDGPLLVLAGAGSGKTRVITRRVAYLISQGIAPWNILAITFTNKAAAEMRRRVEAVSAARGTTLCTFHALCARLLREFAAETALSPNFSIYDRNDQVRVVKEAMARAEVPTDRIVPASAHAAISRAKNKLLTAAGYSEQADGFRARQVAKVYQEYERMLAASNALDFDDLLLRVALLLRDRPDVRRELAERYRFLLIDEYQDTNHAQYVIAHGIAMDHHNICATGDPDQSIYTWRGADINNILEFEADYPDAAVIRLEENYRSTPPILTAASRLIARNTLRKEKALWTRREGGADVTVVCTDDETAEAGEIARRIAAARAAGCGYDDIAVFYRINSLSRVLERALIEAAIPYRIARGIEFYNRKEVKDVLAYLKLIVNPSDDLSCARVINTPARKIGATTVKRLDDFARSGGTALLDACRHGPDAGRGSAAAKRTAAFADLIASFAASLQGSVKDIMEQVLRRSGLLDALRQAADQQDDRPLANVEELLSEAAEFDENHPGAALPEYLNQVSLISDVDHFEGGGGAVSLMTLHAAKGLEFPIVFLVACEEGILPIQRNDNAPAGGGGDAALEEERRLAFVGMTRAKEELILTHARVRRIRGRVESQSESRFLLEIEGEGVRVEDRTTFAAAVAQPRRRPGRSGGFYADADERAAIEAMSADEFTKLPPDLAHLRAGSLVRHPTFGPGKVLKLSQRWPDTRAEILFQHCGRKTIVVAKGKLELAEE